MKALLLAFALAGCTPSLAATTHPALGLYPAGELNGPPLWTLGLKFRL